MLNVGPANLKDEPFPHLVQRGLFDPDVYAELKATYPRFDAAPGWRRMSKDLMRGDELFAKAVSQGVWKELFDYINSTDFLTTMVDLFNAGLQSSEFLANPGQLKMTDYVETREWIASNNVGKAIDEFDGPLGDLFVRMDFGVGEMGYSRPPHLDWRHRVCSMLIYFDNPKETKMKGGQFLVHDAKINGYPIVAALWPDDNVGILKLDSNRALHSVSKITAIEGQRKTLFIGISSRGRVWRNENLP